MLAHWHMRNFRAPALAVRMTAEQESLQDTQVKWLQEAIAAQHRKPTETMNRASLRMETPCNRRMSAKAASSPGAL